MAFKTFTIGAVLTDNDLNTYLMKQTVIKCTSGSRPSSPDEGMKIWETDTDRERTYNGSTWWLTGGKMPFRHLEKDPGLAGISFSNSTVTTITGLTTGSGDQGSSSGLTYSSGVVTVSEPGLYEINGAVGYETNGSGYRQARILAAGVTYRTQVATTSAGAIAVPVSRQVSLTAGQTIQLEGFQNSGGTVTGPTDRDMTYLMVRYLGPA